MFCTLSGESRQTSAGLDNLQLCCECPRTFYNADPSCARVCMQLNTVDTPPILCVPQGSTACEPRNATSALEQLARCGLIVLSNLRADCDDSTPLQPIVTATLPLCTVPCAVFANACRMHVCCQDNTPCLPCGVCDTDEGKCVPVDGAVFDSHSDSLCCKPFLIRTRQSKVKDAIQRR